MKRLVALLALVELTLVGAASPQLPVLSVTTVAGQPLRFERDRHEIVIVHYWASWCAPCRLEMPMLDAVWRKYGKEGVRVIGIALDAGAGRQKIAAAAEGVGFPLARLADSNIHQREVPSELPETLVYDRDGRLRYTFGGGGRKGGTMLSASALDRIIPPLLAERF